MLIWTPQQSRVWRMNSATITQVSTSPDDGFGQWGIIGVSSGSAVKGQVMRFQGDSGDPVSYTKSFDFTVPNANWGTCYVRLTDVGSFAATASSNAIDGSTWHALTEDSNNITWSYEFGGPAARTCSTQVELALDSGGTAIEATGTLNITCSATA